VKPVILLVDDQPQIRRALKTPLSSHGYVIIEAKSGEEAIDRIRGEKIDLVILDINMPGMGGLAACKEIRESYEVPIIVLSARDAEKDKVAALDAGADDYVEKPFGMEELLARVRANLRRHSAESGDNALSFSIKDLAVDFERRTVRVRGELVKLTPKEFELLHQLVRHRGKPLTHRELLQAVWGPDYGEQTEYLRVFINQLRKKIERDPAKPVYIQTEPWVGYRFEVPEGSLTKS
jgi:two-component system, OmpR family, KDP operon response regulator KdpE